MERRVGGLAYLKLVTELLQRQRIADPVAGLWEAADLQWWFARDPHPNEAVVWLDGDVPVGAVVFTRCKPTRYGCDMLGHPPRSAAWEFVRRRCAELPDASVEMAVGDKDAEAAEDAARAGFLEVSEEYEVMWLDAAERAPSGPFPAGYTLVPRRSAPHVCRVRTSRRTEWWANTPRPSRAVHRIPESEEKEIHSAAGHSVAANERD